MNHNPSKKIRFGGRLTAGAAAIAILAAAGFGAVTAGTAPVLADAVRVEAPAAPGFADVVEKVSPAVVSVRVTASWSRPTMTAFPSTSTCPVSRICRTIIR